MKYLPLLSLLWLTLSCSPDPEAQTVAPLEAAYEEQYRPQFHFSPPTQWMNDPNGMVYYEGEYHLFYQYHPYSNVWGPMHWGHAVSKDLVQWENLPIAIYPDDSLGTIFSGSAVVDWDNTSGLGENGEPPLVAIFTLHDSIGERVTRTNTFQTQGIAYSNDKGRTWTHYEGNPVIQNPGIRDFRDPKVSWHEESEQWVMVLAARDRIMFYTSPNLKEWTLASEFGADLGAHGGVWECPDLFELSVQGTSASRWVLLVSINPGGPNGGSATQYFIGDFDGHRFTLDPAFSDYVGKKAAVLPEGTVFADFEKGYGDWQLEGEAFGKEPARGAIGAQNLIEGFLGNALANSFFSGDRSKGKLISPAFTIEADYINFLIGGGQHQGQTCMNLLVDGKAIKTATGKGTEKLAWHAWDVSQWKGQRAHIEIIDDHTGGWGHINVDHIQFANTPARPATQKAVWLDYGRDNYAGVTWSDIPEEDGRRLFIGWMSNWDYAEVVPTTVWRSAMTLPRELQLITTSEGLRLSSKPVRELETLRQQTITFEAVDISPTQNISEEYQLIPRRLELSLDISLQASSNGRFGLQLSNENGETYRIGFDGDTNQFFSDRTKARSQTFSEKFADAVSYAPRILQDSTIKMHFFIDESSIELFADDGATVMTELFFPTEAFTTLSLFADKKGTRLTSGQAYQLSGIWE